MFRFSIATVIGLSAALSAAHADTIIYQGTPTFDPLIITHGETADAPAVSGSILADPAFHRLAQMCSTLGLECGSDHVTPEGGIAPQWTDGHRADAEKRLARLMEERGTFVLGTHFPPAPMPNTAPAPQIQFGWSAPAGSLHIGPRPTPWPNSLSHLMPPRTHVPTPYYGTHTPNLSGFFHRLNTPGVAMHNGIPLRQIPRHSFPWRSH